MQYTSLMNYFNITEYPLTWLEQNTVDWILIGIMPTNQFEYPCLTTFQNCSTSFVGQLLPNHNTHCIHTSQSDLDRNNNCSTSNQNFRVSAMIILNTFRVSLEPSCFILGQLIPLSWQPFRLWHQNKPKPQKPQWQKLIKSLIMLQPIQMHEWRTNTLECNWCATVTLLICQSQTRDQELADISSCHRPLITRQTAPSMQSPMSSATWWH